jgi:predicted SprT family Zn-dependent metalloprotease
MDKKTLIKILDREALAVWDALCEIYPALVAYDCPRIVLNGRLWRVAGYCTQEKNVVELGYKFFTNGKKYAHNMIDVILPHEIIHQADYNLFGDSEKICGHGEKWCEMMVQYGLKPEPFHTMEIKR